MSLQDCIRKAGKALSRDDADAIMALVEGGVDEATAVDSYISSLDQEVESVIAQAVEAGATVERPAALEQSAYHGTPHRFDKFSLDAIGTGEGAQAYGWGLYFASNRGIAEWYKDVVGSRLSSDQIEIGGKNYGSFREAYADGAITDEEWRVVDENEIDDLIASVDVPYGLEVMLGYPTGEDIPIIRGLAEKTSPVEIKGNLYQVDIPEDNELLDWDAPLSEQPEAVKEALRKSNQKIGSAKVEDWLAVAETVGIENTSMGTEPDGQDIYRALSRETSRAKQNENADRAASKYLSSIGIKGLRYKDATARGTDGDSYNYVIWDEEAVTVEAVNDELIQARELEQAGEAQPRGTIQLLESGERIIRLGAKSDLSTFIHESGHLFLEMEKMLSAQHGLTEQDQALLDWLGVKSFDDVTVEHHEKFAESFEAYLKEGKSPSLALRDAFAAFARWLVHVYKSMTGLQRADMTPQIRSVFDQMLATNDQIEEAAADPQYDQFFSSIEASGMTPEQWAKYQERRAKAKDRASGDLHEKIVKQIQQRLSKDWKDEKRGLIDEERARLEKEPVYQIISDLADNPMDWDATLELLGIDKPTGRLIGKLKKGGVDPVEYAETYGYSSVNAMLDDVIKAPSLKKAADDAAQQRMLDKHGDILNDGTAQDLARQAMANDVQVDTVLQEIKALDSKRADINREYLKSEAKAMIARMKYSEIRPSKYYQAVIRAAKASVAAKTKDEKIQAKLQQLANHYLYRESLKARDRMEMWRTHIKSVQTRQYDTRKVNPYYAQNMRALAKLYDTRKDQTQAIDNLLGWYEAQVEDPNMYLEFNLLDQNLAEAYVLRKEGNLAAEYKPKDINELTFQETQGLYDMLRHMRFVGGKMSEEGAAEIQAQKKALGERVEQTGGKDIEQGMGEVGKHDREINDAKHLVSRLDSLRNLLRILDGGNEGPFHDYIWLALHQAEGDKLTLNKELHATYEEEMNGHYKLGISQAARTNETVQLDDGRQWTLSSAGRFMLAMNWGNDSNRKAVMDGYGITENDAMRMIGKLTPEQLKLVNATWKVNESLWPRLSAAAVRLLGAAPPKLQAVPFMVNGVEMSGGHMRLFYKGGRQQTLEDKDIGSNLTKISPSVAASAQARVGSGGKEVSLDINNLSRAWNDNTHYIAYAEAARKISSLITSRDVIDVIERKHGQGFSRALIDTVKGITSNRSEVEQVRFFSNMLRLTRRALTAKYLMYSVRNVVQQFSSLPYVMKEVGGARFIATSAKIVANRKETLDFIYSKSPQMADRAALVNREAALFMKNMEVSSEIGHIWKKFGELGFAPQTFVDAAFSYPVWLAKYEESINKYNNEKRAVSDADTAVAESVGSGSDLFLGGIYQSNNPEWVKAITLMGSWQGMVYNRIHRSAIMTGKKMSTDMMAEILGLPIAVSVMSAVLVMDIPEKEDDILGWLTENYFKFIGGTVPVLRDFIGAIFGMPVKTPLGSAVEALSRIPKTAIAVTEGQKSALEASKELLTQGVTSVVPIPGSGTVIRFVDYLESYEEGDEGRTFNAYQALVEGKNRND